MMRFLKKIGACGIPYGRLGHYRNSSAAVQYAVTSLEKGQKIGGYTVKKVSTVNEFSLTAVWLTHEKTGAQHLHLARDDSDNAFGVAFRTTPMDSTGVPHILEHTALCGSEKFPVRDPFFKMLNRSLSTFMNAMTASDWTIYPFSTQNPQDFENLMRVYLDATFFPKLTEQDFRQEGWRLEHSDLQDPSSPIVFKGVVYNEMKGVYTSSQNIFYTKHQNYLLPNHTYGVCSGGDPKNITDLSWKQLRDFHENHYHPSNAKFYTYGNIALEKHLALIEENVLSKFSKINPNTEVPPQPRWTEPREYKISCAPDPMAADPKKQTTIAVSFLSADITDDKEQFIQKILSSLLTQGEKAPFYKSLISSNIGSDFSPVIGHTSHTKDTYFSVGLQGINPNDVDKVKHIIDETIDRVIAEGFEQERIDALLHMIELSLKHQTNQFGLNLGINLTSSWNHGADPIDGLNVKEHVEYFHNCMRENPKFLQDRVEQYLKNNPHRLTLVMTPDESYDEGIQNEEKERLQGMVEALKEQDKDRLLDEGRKLAEAQMTEEDLSCLPTLKVTDIEPKLPSVPTSMINSGGIPIQLSEQPTNGVSYFRAIANMKDLPAELKPYVPLFCAIVTKMGAGNMDFQELSQLIDLHTGGLSASAHISQHHTHENTFEEGILFSSYCLDKNVNKMFDLWQEIFHRLDISDEQRFATLLQMSAADLSNSIVGSGHSYAMTHAASSLSPAAQLTETMSGMSQVTLMKHLAEQSDLALIISHMKSIAAHVLNKNNFRCALNVTPDASQRLVASTDSFLSNLGGSPLGEDNFSTRDFEPQLLKTHFELPFQVNYASRSVKTVPFTHPDFASLRLLARLMTNNYLHREIREKGGAYGGGAMSHGPGTFNFFSYRDPNSMKTFSAFDGAVEWALKGSFTQQDIDEAKLSVFSKADSPVSPGNRGMRLFLSGISDSARDTHREQLFAVKKDNLIDVSQRYLSEGNRISAVTLLGPENSSTDKWIIRKES